MNRAIVTSFDGNYLEYSKVLIKSFARNYNGLDVLDFICLVPLDLVNREREYIASFDESVRAKLKISFRTSHQYEELVSTGSYSFVNVEHVTQNAMQRIFLASTLNEYGEVIYIDPDTLILRDVHPLLNYPLHNRLAAVTEPDYMNVRTFKDPDRPYFNNGVFITDLTYWRDNGLEDLMLRWLLDHGPTDCIEQDLMNRFFFEVWAPLPTSFNFRQEYAGLQIFSSCEPLIVHFVGETKPWNLQGDTLEYEAAWLSYYREMI